MNLPSIYPRMSAADQETWSDMRYRWDNASRPQSDCCVVQRTLAGRIQFTMRGRTLEAGSDTALLFTHSEASVYSYPPDGRDPYQLQFVAFHPGALRPLFEALRREFGSVVRMRSRSDAAQVLDEIVRRQRAHRFRDQLEAGEMLARLLFALQREQSAPSRHDDPVAHGRHLLREGAGSLRSLKDIARLAGVSREHFVREYARRYGRTPGAELRTLRLGKARAMLIASSHSLADIAAACGFGSDDALRRSFRRQYGCNPLDLRRS